MGGGGWVKKRKRNLLFQKIHIGSPNLCYNVYLHMFFFHPFVLEKKITLIIGEDFTSSTAKAHALVFVT